MRAFYTEGQRSVLCIIAGEVKRRGICDLPIDRIAALAGVCRTTVQTTLREAQSSELFHLKVIQRPRPGQKNLTNIVEIVSHEWFEWTRRAPSPARAIEIGSSSASTVQNGEHHEEHRKKKERGGR